MVLDSPHLNDKNKLFRDIQIVSFAIDDVKLFLDTHPHDENALNYFRHYRDLLQEMRTQYIERFGPLTAMNSKAENTWNWVEGPWPWEMED
jgi:spore coat protein JB